MVFSKLKNKKKKTKCSTGWWPNAKTPWWLAKLTPGWPQFNRDVVSCNKPKTNLLSVLMKVALWIAKKRSKKEKLTSQRGNIGKYSRFMSRCFLTMLKCWTRKISLFMQNLKAKDATYKLCKAKLSQLTSRVTPSKYFKVVYLAVIYQAQANATQFAYWTAFTTNL